MGINRQDVLMVNQSLQDLGDTLMKRRALKQAAEQNELDRMMQQLQIEENARQRKLDRDMEGKRIDQSALQHADDLSLRRDQLSQAKDFQTMETDLRREQLRADEEWKAQLFSSREAQQTAGQFTKFYDQLNESVQQGTMTPEAANQAARQFVNRTRQGTEALLRSSAFGLLLEDPKADLFSQPPAKGGGAQKPPAVQLDLEATLLEEQAAKETNLRRKASLLKRAEALRSNITKPNRFDYRQITTRGVNSDTTEYQRIRPSATRRSSRDDSAVDSTSDGETIRAGDSLRPETWGYKVDGRPKPDFAFDLDPFTGLPRIKPVK
jgi:hypothetical protein